MSSSTTQTMTMSDSEIMNLIRLWQSGNFPFTRMDYRMAEVELEERLRAKSPAGPYQVLKEYIRMAFKYAGVKGKEAKWLACLGLMSEHIKKYSFDDTDVKLALGQITVEPLL
jgi:hypothetical protein